MELAEWFRGSGPHPDRALEAFPPGSGISPRHYRPDLGECRHIGFAPEYRWHVGPIQTEFEYSAKTGRDCDVPVAVVDTYEECGSCGASWRFDDSLAGTMPPPRLQWCRTTGIERGIRTFAKTYYNDQVLQCDVPYSEWAVALHAAWMQCFLPALVASRLASVIALQAWLEACQTCIEDRYEIADGLYRLKRPAESRH